MKGYTPRRGGRYVKRDGKTERVEHTSPATPPADRAAKKPAKGRAKKGGAA